jgi:RHS repeat-associated protein
LISALGNQVVSYGYDGFLLTQESSTGVISGTVSFGYDNNFWITRIGVNGDLINYGYDNDGLLTQAGSLNLSRDTQNGLLTATSLASVNTSLSYNGYGELTAEYASYGGSMLYNTTYTRDDLGRITQKAETINGVTTKYVYSYDAAGRLVEVKENNTPVASYNYDSNGNRNGGFTRDGTISASVDAQDRLTNYNGIVYDYTANGELQSKTESGVPTSYTYDVLGNLMSVTLPGDVTIEYVIDGNNRRIGKKVNGALQQGFLYQNQLNIVAELDGNNNVVSRFVYGSKGNVPDYMIKGGVTYRIISDHLGSPRLVVNASNGQVVQHIDYDEFGNVLNDTNPGFQPFGFAGGIYDQHTGLVRFGARDYDPQVGRWTVKDPIGFGGGYANLYTYVGGNPVNWVDPYGLEVQVCSQPALGWMPVDHQWIKTDTVEAGMGPTNGDGANAGNNSGDFPGDPVEVTDHSTRDKTGSSCEKVDSVSESKVNELLKIGKPLGNWGPTNHCQSFVEQVLEQSRIDATTH